jgi:hypothetical protein
LVLKKGRLAVVFTGAHQVRGNSDKIKREPRWKRKNEDMLKNMEQGGKEMKEI